MDLIPWLTVAFIIIGFFVLGSKKKAMESKLAFIKGNMGSKESSIKTKSIVYWIVSTVTWGLVSISLIVWSFHNYYG
ncbi:hypothetical protein AB5I83_22720 [Mesobacillus sp. LC4]